MSLLLIAKGNVWRKHVVSSPLIHENEREFLQHFFSFNIFQIKGADGSVVAIINIHRERCRRPKFTLTLMEEVSTANKALFIGCVITLVSSIPSLIFTVITDCGILNMFFL